MFLQVYSKGFQSIETFKRLCEFAWFAMVSLCFHVRVSGKVSVEFNFASLL